MRAMPPKRRTQKAKEKRKSLSPSRPVTAPAERPRASVRPGKPLAIELESAPAKRLQITDVVLRDAHQSLLATRMRTEDMLPIAEKLDGVGYWSLEVWGGATFDICLRYLKEDPWERLRALRAAMPNTRLQMLLRGQNIVGYRHYPDDVLDAFIERSAANGIDVFRIFDALNDTRNMERAIGTITDAGTFTVDATDLAHTVMISSTSLDVSITPVPEASGGAALAAVGGTLALAARRRRGRAAR